ncbi:MAG: hypothetical protein E6K90_09795 [Thaumarchaeota archaeon]|nr:MAG: hypothetical protein E6K89_01995 [Nitrososphaerota archaeon]TLX98208.1 MAG: hypothetical protein E6K90_09795 [Nitrososphaerota archaeon]
MMIFLVKGFLPSPTADFLVIFEALLVGLSFLILGRGGATYVEMVNGLLQTPVKLSLAPFSLLLALFFGVQVDAYASLLKVRNSEAKAGRLVATLSLSSATTGVVAYYSTAVVAKLVPSDLSIALTILIFGVVSGAAAGYLAARIWNGNLKSRFQG